MQAQQGAPKCLIWHVSFLEGMPTPASPSSTQPICHLIMTRFCQFVLLLLLVPTVAAQQSFTINGTVRDAETGETLPYANVFIMQTSQGATTNVDGNFVLLGVEPGKYELRISYLGYNDTFLEIDTANLDGPLDIGINQVSTYLDEVLVTAERFRMMQAGQAVSKVTISPRDAAMLPSIGEVDLFRSLQLLPGISGTNEGSSGLFVRGGTPDQTLVLLDGMTVYHVDHFFGFFSAFNADAIKDVQVYKGGFPASYGGRTSSVVELTGLSGSNDFGVGVGLNLLSAQVAAEVPLGQRASLMVAGRRSYTDVLRTGVYNSIYDTLTGADPTATRGGQGPGGGFGSAERPGGGGALRGEFQGPGQVTFQPDFYFYDVNAKLNFRPSDKDVLALSFYNGRDNLDESRLTTNDITRGNQSGGTVVTDIYDITGWGNLGVSAKWSRQWSPRAYSNLLLAYSEYFSENTRNSVLERYAAENDSLLFSGDAANLEDNRLGDFSLRLDNEFHLSKAHKFDAGFQATRSDVKYTNVRNDTLTVFSEDQSAQQVALYVQDTWKPRASLSLTIGLRGSWYNLTGSTYLEPRASVQYTLSDRFQLKGAFGQYNQFVARVVNENVTEGARDFWLLADEENVGIQESTHYVLGASYETPSWLFDIEAYRKNLAGLSEFSLRFQRGGADFVADDLFFDGSGVARGLEFLLQRKVGRMTGWLSYTLAEVKHAFSGLNGGESFPALHDQPHELKLVGTARLGSRWNLSATWAFATGKPYTSPESQYTLTLLDGSEQSYIHVGEKNEERLPNYHRLDMAVHYRFPVGRSDIDIGFSVFNLYNRTNVWYKEFDLSQSPFVTSDVSFLGITPNLSVRIDF